MDILKDLIESSEVLVLSKDKCKYCDIAKNELKSTNYKVTIIEIDSHQEGVEIFQAAKELTGQKTVPNIWIKGKHIGGSDNLSKVLLNERISNTDTDF